MKQDKEKTRVIFRKFKGSEDLIALFPQIPGDNDIATCSSYMHIGQHGAANLVHCMCYATLPAEPKEYEGLKKELEGLGYNLEIRSRTAPGDYSKRKKAITR